jgi:hypothetical protein
VAGCESLLLAAKAVRLRDGALQLTLSRPADSLGALPAWLSPVRCNLGHTGVYRSLVLDFSGSSLACLVKVCVVPDALRGAAAAGGVTVGALCAARSHCVALLAIEAGTSVTLPMPFGTYFVKYLAGAAGVGAEALQAQCSSAGGRAAVVGEGGGGFVDYVREFDVETGKGGQVVSLCNLDGEPFPEGVSLKCGGSKECILGSVGAACYTSLSVSVTGKRATNNYYF